MSEGSGDGGGGGGGEGGGGGVRSVEFDRSSRHISIFSRFLIFPLLSPNIAPRSFLSPLAFSASLPLCLALGVPRLPSSRRAPYPPAPRVNRSQPKGPQRRGGARIKRKPLSIHLDRPAAQFHSERRRSAFAAEASRGFTFTAADVRAAEVVRAVGRAARGAMTRREEAVAAMVRWGGARGRGAWAESVFGTGRRVLRTLAWRT